MPKRRQRISLELNNILAYLLALIEFISSRALVDARFYAPICLMRMFFLVNQLMALAQSLFPSFSVKTACLAS